MLSTLASATDLAGWANQVAATADLPALVRRLVLTTVPDANRASFRTGEGTRYPGWDGIVRSEAGNAFVPAGVSVWEMGTDARVKQKANKEIVKRTKDPLGLEPSECTLVFVSPRRWQDKDGWAEAQIDAGPWQDVRVIDADDLEGWLTLSLVTHAWISAKVGKAPTQVRDLNGFWLDWSGASAPVLSSELVVAGRVASSEQIQKFTLSQPGTLSVQGDSQEESLAFVASAFRQMTEPDRSVALDRALIVYDPSAWREVLASEQALILLPAFPAVDGSGVPLGRHHVIVPLGRETAQVGPSLITLGPARREIVSAELRAAGIPEPRANSLARQARRSLLPLRRKLARNPELQQPAWARPGVSRSLLAAMVAGYWKDSREGDRATLISLAADDADYDTIANDLAQLEFTSDPPLRRIGDTWILSSHEDAYSLLSRYLTSGAIARLRSTLVGTLAAVDPVLALPAEERWMAGARGQVRAESDLLRRGLAESLVLLAAVLGDERLAGGPSGSELAASIVRDILARANEDSSGNLWRSLDDVLPAFAEAAPDEFLAAVDSDLRRLDSRLLAIVAEANQRDFMSRWYHTGMLWGLERLAWSPEYLPRCTLILGRLATVPLDYRVGNSPIDTLRSIFITWQPQTAATAEQRAASLDNLRLHSPDVAWTLMLRLIPDQQDIGHYSNLPRWRDWKPADGPSPSIPEVHHEVAAIVNRLMEDGLGAVKRYHDLIALFPRLPAEAQDELLEALRAMDDSTMPPETNARIVAALRELVSRHRRFPGADWAMPRELVDRIAEVHAQLEPNDPIERLGWLFTDFPNLVDTPAEDERYGDAQRSAQERAARVIYEAHGLSGVLRVAERHHSGIVGRTLGASKILTDDDETLGTVSGSRPAGRCGCARCCRARARGGPGTRR